MRELNKYIDLVYVKGSDNGKLQKAWEERLGGFALKRWHLIPDKTVKGTGNETWGGVSSRGNGESNNRTMLCVSLERQRPDS